MSVVCLHIAGPVRFSGGIGQECATAFSMVMNGAMRGNLSENLIVMHRQSHEGDGRSVRRPTIMLTC